MATMQPTERAPAPWMEAVEEIAPTVLVLGGLLTAPPLYFPLRARLLERGAAVRAGREMRLEGGALARGEPAVHVFRQPVSPLVVHRSRYLRSAIRA